MALVSNKYNSLSAFDENFGMGMDFNILKRQFREWVEKQSDFRSDIDNDSRTAVTTQGDKFQVTIDVYQFRSEEITIKVVGSNTICIEGKHEEQHANRGFISRHFMRRFTLPDGFDIKNVVSTLSSDGVLRIIAPRNGQTINDYHKVAIEQTNTSEKCLNKAPVQQHKNNEQVSFLQNQQTLSNNINIERTTKEIEETHNYIQQFLHNIENKYKVVPIRQVGPFSKTDESLQTYHKQKECRTVPIQQTSTTYSSSFEKEIESSRTPFTKTEVSNNMFEKQVNRKSSVDTQKELVQEYRSVPIQQTGKQSSQTTSKTQNTTHESRTIPIEQQTKHDRTHIVEETRSYQSEKDIYDSHNYRTIPIQQTEMVQERRKSTDIQCNKFANTENRQGYTNTLQEEIRKENNAKNISTNTETIEESTTHECNYKTIPIKQVGVASQTSETKTESSENTSQRRTIPIEEPHSNNLNKTSHTSEYINTWEMHDKTTPNRHFQVDTEHKNHTDSQYIENVEEKRKQREHELEEQIRILQKERDVLNNIDKTITSQETHEQKNNSIKSQYNIQTTFEGTENWECNVNKKAENTSQEFKTNIDEHLHKKSNDSQHTEQSQNVSSLQNLAQQSTLSSNQQNNLLFQESDYSKEDVVKDGYKQTGFTKKNAKAEFEEQPHGFKMTKEQSFYSEQTKTKEWNSNQNDKVDQAHGNTYQVQFSVDSNNSERFSRMPSETSEICIEEVTEENEAKTRSGGSRIYKKQETSQSISNSDRSIHVQRN